MPPVNRPPAPPVQVDPTRLRHCGQQLRQQAGQLARDIGTVAGRLRPAPTVTGWEAAAAAERAAGDWGGRLLELAHLLETLARGVVDAADSYAGSDSRAAARSVGVARAR